MESSTDDNKRDRKILRPSKILVWRQFAKPDRSNTPILIKDNTLSSLPPLQLSGFNKKNSTPPPKFSKFEEVTQSISRIKSIVRNSLFPEINKKITARAPSVSDLSPSIAEFAQSKEVNCSKCKKSSSINNETHLGEFNIWRTCSECQDLQFPTKTCNEFSDIITFQSTGEYSEFTPEAKIGFWMEQKFWPSVFEYLQENSHKNAFKANFQKVKQHPRLEKLLKSTGKRELIYFLPEDNYWGVGFNGIGYNKLGQILMEIRSQLN